MWRNVQGWQLVILLVLIIVIFGAARLPNAARSLGKSLKIFKKEVQDLRDDDDDDDTPAGQPQTPTSQPQPPTTQPQPPADSDDEKPTPGGTV